MSAPIAPTPSDPLPTPSPPLDPPPSSPAHAPLKTLYMFNPMSGKKVGRLDWADIVRHLAGPDSTYDLVFTERAAHATDYMLEVDWALYERLVCYGGDGILYEVLQGLLKHPDRTAILSRITIGILPGGSGNGLARSIAAEGGFRCDVERTMAMIAKGGSVRGKLAEVQTSDGKTHYSFLSLTWGLLADIDLDSEFLRFMGGARFDVYAAMRLCWIKTHRAKLLYTNNWPAGADLPPLSEPIAANTGGADWTTIEDGFITIVALLVPWIAMDSKISKTQTVGGSKYQLMIIRRKISKLATIKTFLAFDDKASQADQKTVEMIDCDAFRLTPAGRKNTHHSLDGEEVEYGPIQAVVRPGAWNLIT